ncbi:MAG TPA: MBL fold metallo-hydrolase [Gammaproteobacteria bacterium]|nr:MBL fold metallo-hydrolase [Gammaproteobacteria bacterium]
MRCALVGSGSAGNALIVATATTALLVDCGYSIKALAARLAALDFDPCDLSAVLVTHEHDDHLGGVLPLSRRYRVPIRWAPGTALAAIARHGEAVEAEAFSPHAPFTIGDIEITPVPVPHDAREPTQFVFRHGERRLGVLTDLGSLTPHVIAAYADCDALCLEFNHDLGRLMNSDYPPSLRQRIGSAWGHLSNAQAERLLAKLKGPKLQRVVAAHLSQRTNHPELVAECLARVAPELDAIIASQDAVVPWFEV